MKVVLTGASGCVGQALVLELAKAGHEVLAIVRPGTTGLRPACSFATIEADLTGPGFAARLPGEIDCVLHVAQSRRFREFPDAASEVFAINTAATFQLAEYARKAKAKSFVFTSTGSVYVPNLEPVGEDAPTAPASFYPATKLAAENLLAPFAPLLPVAILRLFYVFGPGQSKMLVDGIADRIRKGVAVSTQGTEGIRLAPTFSADAARIICKAAEEGWRGTYNAGAPAIISLRALATEIGKVVGRPPVFEQLDAPVPPTPLPKLDKLAGLYDLSQFTPLQDALGRTLSAGRDQ